MAKNVSPEELQETCFNANWDNGKICCNLLTINCESSQVTDCSLQQQLYGNLATIAFQSMEVFKQCI